MVGTVLFATAEFAPLVKVGGLADASAGLVAALRRSGLDVEVVLPDYRGVGSGNRRTLDVPKWAGKTSASVFEHPEAGPLTLIHNEILQRPHPYTDKSGEGWPDNDVRFMAFSAAVAAHTASRRPDVLHLNDWHTAAVLGFLPDAPPSVLTMHNPAYQGTTSGDWLKLIPHRPEAYEWYGGTNPLTGAIALSDRVLTVSPTFARELLVAETGFGLTGPLEARGGDFGGILNGIDTGVWDPSTDPHLPIRYDLTNSSRKRELGRRVKTEMGLAADNDPLLGMVTRLTSQKGVDIALEAIQRTEAWEARMVLLGSGDASLAAAARRLAKKHGDRFSFRDGYDEGLAHRIFAGSDLFLVPSRFEPSGLTQMQAMRYGAIPVVSDVGGLHDTVIDADSNPELGTGFVAGSADAASMESAIGRAISAWRSTRRRGRIRGNGMRHDWSWARPSARYVEIYEAITSTR